MKPAEEQPNAAHMLASGKGTPSEVEEQLKTKAQARTRIVEYYVGDGCWNATGSDE